MRIDKKLARDVETDGHDRLVKGGDGVVSHETLLLCVSG
jgi:hypothetical protein